jgi:hypothetical protein
VIAAPTAILFPVFNKEKFVNLRKVKTYAECIFSSNLEVVGTGNCLHI